MEDPKGLPKQCPFSSAGGSGLSRREFLKVATVGAVAASSLGGLGARPAAMAAADARPHRFSSVGRVVHARHPGAMADSLRPDARIIREMVDRGIQELTGKSSPAKAWGTLVIPEDVVGIKLNCTGGHHVSSHPAVVEAIQAGVTLSLKNLAFGTIDNTRRFHPPEILCDPVIAEVCAHPILRQRTVLHVLDGLHGQYDNGPSPDPRYVWKHNGLLFSTDPVALDQVGMEIIEARRRQEGLPSLAQVGRPAKHIATAARLGLGTNDRGKIEEVVLDLSG